MPVLSILLRLDRAPDLNVARAKQRLAAIGHAEELTSSVNLVEGVEEGGYINVTYSAKDIRALWSLVRTQLSCSSDGQPSLLGCSIVVCTGKFGWDDYLLLHHFNESEALDKLE